MDNNGFVMILVAAPVEAAAEIARALVARKAAACAQVSPPVTSFYQWKGDLHEDKEALVFIKTAAKKIEDVKRSVLEMHPYEVPEIVVLPIVGGNEAYFRWIDASVGTAD